jgi:hypothetical protein
MRRMTEATTYTAEFYDQTVLYNYNSAYVVLPLLCDLAHPRSVVDVECGVGPWLAVAEDLGVERALGLEGPWITDAKPYRAGLDIRVYDLETPLTIRERFDLALCLEVAEHLSEARAQSLVADLCNLADCVFFGAAVPTQPGIHHVNCQWQSYWAKLFKNNGRVAIDAVRPMIWGKTDVAYYYQQNPLLYVTEGKAAGLGYDPSKPIMYDIAHPALIEHHLVEIDSLARSLSLSGLLREFPGRLVNAVRRRIVR